MQDRRGIQAEKFNMVEGPGTNSHASSSSCLWAMEKYYLRYNKVFVAYKLPNVFQEGWIQISCGVFCFFDGLSDR